jgi:hypothetical protein
LPRLSRNSPKADRGTVWFDIHDSRAGLTLRNLVNRSFMYGPYRLSISPADKRVGVPQCTRCWRFGHRSDARACPFRACYCPICNGPHTLQFHRPLAACCKGNPNAKPPVPPTPEGVACSHGPRCVNCGRDHRSDDKSCPYWKSRFNAKWIVNRYKDSKVSSAVWQFDLSPDRDPSLAGQGSQRLRTPRRP